ncbi:MAG: T9SS type A sorting domain-containing protein, partial [Cyclobacteriaceae bacterium]
AGDQVSYGVDSWIGYVYDGVDNFISNYKGELFETETFDEAFGGSNVNTSTTGCSFQTETFSVRFKMRKNFGCGDYTFTIGADDGVRLSIDGGATWLISDYSNHGYRTVSSAATSITEGTYDLVLEYFENGGGNRVTFNYNMIGCVLPVTWYSFTGKAKNGYNEIEWKTASEEKNQGFSVERSTDALLFEEIGWINGNGTTANQNTYVFQDYSPNNGANYYRLKQVDFDGVIDYSEIINVNSTIEDTFNVQVYPNPASEYVIVRSNSEGDPEMLLVNITNGQLFSAPFEGNGRFNLTQIPTGIYLVKIRVGDKMIQRKLIVRD